MTKFKTGDVLGLSPTSKNSTYKVTNTYANGTYDVVHSPSGHRTNCDMIGYVLVQSAPTTLYKVHLYKVGDIIEWDDDAPYQYEVVRLYKTPHRYDVRNIQENVLYEDMVAEKDTHLVSSGGTSVIAESIPEKCKWFTKQPIDVEPIYYRIYELTADGVAGKSEQLASSNALVVKRAQHHGVRAVPFCNMSDSLIDIIGESVQEGDRWKAEAFLYCKHCGDTND